MTANSSDYLYSHKLIVDIHVFLHPKHHSRYSSLSLVEQRDTSIHHPINALALTERDAHTLVGHIQVRHNHGNSIDSMTEFENSNGCLQLHAQAISYQVCKDP